MLPFCPRGGFGLCQMHHSTNTHDVEDEGHPPIAENGGSGIALTVMKVLTERFDHDLLRVEEGIYNDAIVQVSGCNDKDMHRPCGTLLWRRCTVAKEVAQVHDR